MTQTPRTDKVEFKAYPWTLHPDHEALNGYRNLANFTRELERENTELAEALQHCLDVFGHMANRGAYPEELLPDEQRYDGLKLFLGKQGFMFAITPLKKREKSINWHTT